MRSVCPLLALSLVLASPLLTTTLPPGPPQILSTSDELQEMEMYDDNTDSIFLEDLRRREKISVEIEAFVSRSPTEDILEISENNVTSDEDYDIIKELLELDDPSTVPVSDLGLVLTWWQGLLLGVGCLLVTTLCCYITSCCYLALDCCSDHYWGCFPSCLPLVLRVQPPPHIKVVKQVAPVSSRFSLNENNGAPRTGQRSSNNNKGSSKSLTVASGDSRREEAERKTSREEADRSHNTLASLASQHSTSATLSSVKSVRNYKRTRPASQMPEEKAPVGLSESLPHVYQDGTGSYFSWLHLFGKSKRRYNVSRRKNPNRGPKTAQYRQTRYRHIAESRNSAVIPTRIAKRASTASTFNTRPHVAMRSRSAETVDEAEDVLSPMLETVVSEKHLPRSRLSANLAQLEPRREDRSVPGYNLRYFEKSLMKSKETTL